MKALLNNLLLAMCETRHKISYTSGKVSFRPKEMQWLLSWRCLTRRGHSSFGSWPIVSITLPREREILISGYVFCWDKQRVWGNLVTISEPITGTTSICSASHFIDLIAIFVIPSPKEERHLFIFCKYHRILIFMLSCTFRWKMQRC